MRKHWINLVLYFVIGLAFILWIGKDSYKKYKLYNNSPMATATVLKNPFYNLLAKGHRFSYNYDIDLEIQEKYIVYAFLTNDKALIIDSIK